MENFTPFSNILELFPSNLNSPLYMTHQRYLEIIKLNKFNIINSLFLNLKKIKAENKRLKEFNLEIKGIGLSLKVI
jgi:hypothetical protein